MSVLALMVAACGGAQRPGVSNGVTVLDPGAEPRKVVQLRPALHVPEWIEQTIKMRSTGTTTDTTLEGKQTHIDYPSILAHERLEATEVEGSDVTLVNAVIEDVRTLDDVVDRRVKTIAARSAANMRGASMVWRLAPDGRASVVDSTLAELPPGILQAFVVAPSFPASPIGVGAKWQESSEITVGGIHWQQQRTYTLTALDASSATIRLDFSATAGSQPLSVEPNATVRLTSGTMTLSATSKLSLKGLTWEGESRGNVETSVLIVKGHLRTQSTVSMEILSISKPSRR